MTAEARARLRRLAAGLGRRLRRGVGALGRLLTGGTMTFGVGRGLRFDAGPSNPRYARGDNELPVQETLARHLRPGHVFYDVGANVGFFTVIAARLVGPSGRVLAFEPVPGNAGLARANAAGNGFDNVEVVARAVGRASGRAELALARYSGGSMLAEVGEPPDPRGERLEVEVVAIDDAVAAGAPPPDVVKIDVEGAELEVLEGMRRTLASRRPVVVLEVDDRTEAAAGRRLDACRALLEELGFEVRPLADSYPDTAWAVRHVVAVPRTAEAGGEPAPSRERPRGVPG
jgi:FkbM family methyltransferase